MWMCCKSHAIAVCMRLWVYSGGKLLKLSVGSARTSPLLATPSPLLTTPFPLLHISVCLGGGGMQVPYKTRTHTKYINKQIWWGQLNENNCRIFAKNTLSRLPEAIICRVVACRKSFNALLRCRCREAKKLSRAQLWSAPGQWCG